jgi:hypothetical protein
LLTPSVAAVEEGVLELCETLPALVVVEEEEVVVVAVEAGWWVAAAAGMAR